MNFQDTLARPVPPGNGTDNLVKAEQLLAGTLEGETKDNGLAAQDSPRPKRHRAKPGNTSYWRAYMRVAVSAMLSDLLRRAYCAATRELSVDIDTYQGLEALERVMHCERRKAKKALETALWSQD
jgi:hypothetical protein